MKKIWFLTSLTFKEGIRDRALFGVMGMALLMLTGIIVVVTLYGYDIAKVTVDLNLSVMSFSGLLLCFFININLISKDMDKRTIYCVLSKPISRSEYILGKYAGTFLLIVVSILLLAGFGSGIILLIKGINPEMYFVDFSWRCYSQAVIYQIEMFLVLNAVMIFFSSFATSSFLTLLYSIATYIVGQSIEEVVQFFHITKSFDSSAKKFFWNMIEYLFPNFAAFDNKVMASHGIQMPLSHTMWLSFYSVLYTGLLLFFAILIFQKRELQ